MNFKLWTKLKIRLYPRKCAITKSFVVFMKGQAHHRDCGLFARSYIVPASTRRIEFRAYHKMILDLDAHHMLPRQEIFLLTPRKYIRRKILITQLGSCFFIKGQHNHRDGTLPSVIRLINPKGIEIRFCKFGFKIRDSIIG